MSIFSICKISRDYADLHNAEVIISTYPGAKSYGKNDLFTNTEKIYSFSDIIDMVPLESLQLHIPEYAATEVLERLRPYESLLSSIKDLRINILNQNILLMPTPSELAHWFKITPKITQTTAHDRYSNQEVANTYGLPLKHLSTFVDHKQYVSRNFDEKKNLIILSPDTTPLRDRIIAKLRKELPEYELVTIQNMKYDEYKALVADARFTITFGEGFDGYYVESFFSGGIALAVYNADFFPDTDFKTYRNTFASYGELLKKCVAEIQYYTTHAKAYRNINQKNTTKINKLYSYDAYRKNIREFYLGKFDYTPTLFSLSTLMTTVQEDWFRQLEEKDNALAEQHALIVEQGVLLQDRQRQINEQQETIAALNENIKKLHSSLSWKATAPLRKVSSIRTRGKKR